MIRRLLMGLLFSAIMFTIGVVSLGWKPYVVMSESMAPAMHAGDLILVDPHASSLTVYEIVTYADARGPVTHRVVSQAEDGKLTLKGDANRQPDTRAVDRKHVIGPVRLILPHVGWPVLQVRTHPVRVAGGVLVLALLFPGRRLLRLILLGGAVAAVAMVPTSGAVADAPGNALRPPSVHGGASSMIGDDVALRHQALTATRIAGLYALATTSP